MRVWNPSWVAPGVSPVQYLDDLGFSASRVMAVHGVQMTAADLARLAARRHDPRHLPEKQRLHRCRGAPIEQFYTSGVQVAVGTDSLASTADLNCFLSWR